MPLQDAKIQINDIGIVRGYGIFDYFQVKNQVPVFLDDHLDRFFNSAQKMRLDLGLSKKELEQVIYELIEINNITQAGLKFVATGGYSENGFNLTTPNVAVIVQDYGEPQPELLENGASLITFPYKRTFPEIKSTNYLVAVYVDQLVKSQNALEPLYFGEESVYETCRANIFGVKNGCIVTPNRNILCGITRKKVLRIAKDLYPCEQRDLPLTELLGADEVFITGTMKRVLPIVRIDNMIIGNGKPGPVSTDLYHKFIQMEALEIRKVKTKRKMVTI